MAPSAWILAIDFGTSNSAAAHSGATSRGIETLPLTHTSNLMPSSVHISGAQQILVGDAAVNAALANPAGFVASPKRLITGAPTITVAGATIPTSVPVAAVMRAVIERGKAAHAGQLPDRLILTHPEAWSSEQIQVLFDAATQSGIDRSRIITVSEPRAAAAHYSRSHSMQPGAKIGVFDFGGGTLDVAVLTVTNQGAFQVVAARGDNGLGGKNLDALVQRWVEERLEERDPATVEWLRRQAPVDVVQAMQDSIRRAKELLSEAPSATITVSTPTGRRTLQITRDELDELIAPAIDQAIRLTRATLLDGGIAHPDQLTALYLTGGSSRIPLVQQRLAELGPVATLDDPKTVVAQGALVVGSGESNPTTARNSAVASGYPNTPGTPMAAQGPAAGAGAAAYPSTLMQQSSSAVSATSSTSDKGKPWGKIAGAGVALLAIAGIVAGVIFTQNDKGGGGTGGDTSSSEVEATAPDGPVTDDQEVVALLPSRLRNASTCRKQGFSRNDAIELMCDINEDSDLADLGDSGIGSYFFSVHVDPSEAKTQIVKLRNGTLSDGKGKLVEDSGRTSAAEIRTGIGSGYKIDYVSTGTGLVMSVLSLKTEKDAQQFLTRSGLID